MKAAYFRGNDVIEITTAPKPVPGPGQLLIQVAGNGICGSDHKILPTGFKRIPGHEVAGTVVQQGEGCETPIGARIAAYIPLHCGECVYCQRGAGNLCRNRAGLLGWSTDGGYAEHMIVPDRNALRLDDAISFAEGVVLLDTIGTAGHAVRLAMSGPTESALVVGAGPIGMGALVMLKAMGVERVYVSEPSAWRREKAAEMGAVAINPFEVDIIETLHDALPYGADIVVEAVGSHRTIWQSFDLVAPGGTISIVGEYWGRLELERPKGDWMLNDIRGIRSFYFTIPEFYENQQMVLDGRVDAASLATHTLPLEQLRAGYDLFQSGEAIKIIVEPNEGSSC